MKIFGTIAIGLVLISGAASAEPRGNDAHVFWCTADGYDHEGKVRSVSGPNEPTRQRAEQSALKLCRQFFGICQLRSCFQQR